VGDHSIKFQENPSGGNRAVICGQTDTWADITKLAGASYYLWEQLKTALPLRSSGMRCHVRKYLQHATRNCFYILVQYFKCALGISTLVAVFRLEILIFVCNFDILQNTHLNFSDHSSRLVLVMPGRYWVDRRWAWYLELQKQWRREPVFLFL
jgi:hypothetical protein